MKSLFATLAIFLSTELALASPVAMNTRIEQVSATLNGQVYRAQITEVQMAASSERKMVVSQIAVAAPAGPTRIVNSVNVEAPAQLNGTSYTAVMPEPLLTQDREQAISLAQNQVDWVRRQAPPEIARSIQAYPTYLDTVVANSHTINFSPDDPQVAVQAQRLTDSAMQNSSAAYAGLLQQEQAHNLDAANFAQAVRQGQIKTMQLQNAAAVSSFTCTASLTNFSNALSALQDLEVASLASRIRHADPTLENVTSSEAATLPAPDIQRATADVSPLNPHARENLKVYGERFKPNGLLSRGLFANDSPFPATALGHRTLESANLLSDAVNQDLALTHSPATLQLVGAGYLYMHAAMRSLQAGQLSAAEHFGNQGRRFARALHGDDVPDDIENAMVSTPQAIAMHEQAVREALGVSGEGRELLKQAYATASPDSAEGQAALQMGRSLLANPAGLNENQLLEVGLSLLDLGVGLVPGVSPIKSLIYLAAGRNLLTGQTLSKVDDVFCAIDILTLGLDGPFAKIAAKLPNALEAMRSGAGYVKNFSKFIKGSIAGIRELEAVKPGFATLNFISHPGAVLALGQNITKHGGAELAEKLVAYSAEHSLGIVETAHISQFAGGYTRFVSAADFELHGGAEALTLAGKDGGRMFAASTEQFANASSRIHSDTDLVEFLGLDPVAKDYSRGLMRFDMEFDLGVNPRLPSGMEPGVNKFFNSGGETSGKAFEIVIDPHPMNKVIARGKVSF